MKQLKAIAAMSENRVIGHRNQLPWHLPEDFQWFKKMTTGHVLVMGRKTFESLGGPLPNRETIVLSRHQSGFPGVKVVSDFDQLDFTNETRDVFVCGGAQVYAQLLPRCADLYLTLVKRVVEGDAFFPAFEGVFALEAELADRPLFKILHYRNRTLNGAQAAPAEVSQQSKESLRTT